MKRGQTLFSDQFMKINLNKPNFYSYILQEYIFIKLIPINQKTERHRKKLKDMLFKENKSAFF